MLFTSCFYEQKKRAHASNACRATTVLLSRAEAPIALDATIRFFFAHLCYGLLPKNITTCRVFEKRHTSTKGGWPLHKVFEGTTLPCGVSVLCSSCRGVVVDLLIYVSDRARCCHVEGGAIILKTCFCLALLGCVSERARYY